MLQVHVRAEGFDDAPATFHYYAKPAAVHREKTYLVKFDVRIQMHEDNRAIP